MCPLAQIGFLLCEATSWQHLIDFSCTDCESISPFFPPSDIPPIYTLTTHTGTGSSHRPRLSTHIHPHRFSPIFFALTRPVKFDTWQSVMTSGAKKEKARKKAKAQKLLDEQQQRVEETARPAPSPFDTSTPTLADTPVPSISAARVGPTPTSAPHTPVLPPAVP
ncbi:hypothetical protein DFH09DRAFT_396754 [Mycena vulgaris]|nr:hypothetical protein DFH09DRAFT_396754 [Mycena vulgaris]